MAVVSTARQRSAALRRERVKRYRARQASGAAVLRIAVADYCALASVLIDSGSMERQPIFRGALKLYDHKVKVYLIDGTLAAECNIRPYRANWSSRP